MCLRRALLHRLFTALVLVLAVSQAAPAADGPSKPSKPGEAARVRFLIVADSAAKQGAACALDGANLKAVLEAGLGRQKLSGRYTIDVIAGRDVTPRRVLQYYQDLKLKANEALVFYYSGHGAYHRSRGHLLTFNQGDLSCAAVLAAMQRHKPRLAVVLTDCCAAYEGAAPKMPAALPGKRALALATDEPPPHPPRPKDYQPPSAKVPPPAVAIAHPPRPTNYRPPPPFVPHPDDNVPGSDTFALRTAEGRLPLKTLLAQTDGAVLRHLFYRHTGVVDINGCETGKVAYATTRWGGGLFTITLLSMQKHRAARFDANRNGLVEWREFFPSLRASCAHTGAVLCKGAIRQAPQAHRLGQPVIQIAGR